MSCALVLIAFHACSIGEVRGIVVEGKKHSCRLSLIVPLKLVTQVLCYGSLTINDFGKFYEEGRTGQHWD